MNHIDDPVYLIQYSVFTNTGFNKMTIYHKKHQKKFQIAITGRSRFQFDFHFPPLLSVRVGKGENVTDFLEKNSCCQELFLLSELFFYFTWSRPTTKSNIELSLDSRSMSII